MTAIKQSSFSGGEFTPSVYARSDLSRYSSGLKTCRNFMVMRQGGIANRPGTEFIGETADSTKPCRLIPFIFNAEQAYLLELFEKVNQLYVRPYKDGAPILETALNITAITNASPAVITINSHGLSTNDEVYVSGVAGMTELNGKFFRVNVVDSNTFRLRIKDDTIGSGTFVNSTSYGTYTSGGTVQRLYTFSTPYVISGDEGTYLSELNFAQNADVLTIVHPNHVPIEISRTAETNWSGSISVYAPGISSPSNVTAIPNVGGSGTISNIKYQVTALLPTTSDESLPATSAASYNGTIPDASNPWTVAWTSVPGAQEYNIYRSINANGIYGLVGTSASNAFVDTAPEPDFEMTPPIARDPFSGTGNFPSAVAYHQQRLVLANTDNNPENVYMSRIGTFKNFTVKAPLQDDDAITFPVSGNQVNEVRHLIGLKRLIALTSGGEWSVEGNDAGTISPNEINLKQHSSNGIGRLRPLIVNGSLLYVQARGSLVRNMVYSSQDDGYAGNDLTVYSSHLFDGHEIIDWCYQQIPHSIVWLVRDDGILLGYTFMPEQEMFAWHRHDFSNAEVENVCVIPEDRADSVYLVIKRTIDGIERRYIERMSMRNQSDIVDYKIMDSTLSYDGRNTVAGRKMLISGGSTYSHLETLTLTAYQDSTPAAYFTADDIGNAVHMEGEDGTKIRFTITGYVSSSQVTGRSQRTVPSTMHFPNLVEIWGKAVDEISGLDHLEGENVSILGDGFVIANPNNETYATYTVTNGAITLRNPAVVIHVGLPFISDAQTLDIDTPQGVTLADKNKLISKVSVYVESSRGIWAGIEPPSDDEEDPLENLHEFQLRTDESYDEPTELKTGVVDVILKSHWNKNGRVFIRQVDPLPLSILAIVPDGYIPFGR